MKKVSLFNFIIFPFLVIAMEPSQKKQKVIDLPSESETKQLFKQMSDALNQIPNTSMSSTPSTRNANVHTLRAQLGELLIFVGQLQQKDISPEIRIENLQSQQEITLETYKKLKQDYDNLHNTMKRSCQMLKVVKAILDCENKNT